MMDSHPSRGHTRQEMIANAMLKGEGGLCFFSFGSSEACRERENLGNLKGLSSVCLGLCQQQWVLWFIKALCFPFQIHLITRCLLLFATTARKG